jgi:hypothetical protein
MLMRQLEDDRSQAPSRGSATLRVQQCQHVAAVVAELRPDWSVELHHNPHGKTLIVILPDDLDSALNPTIVVRGDDAIFHVEELRGDTYRKLGEHWRWGDVLRAVRSRLIWEMPFPPTLH